MGLVAKNKTMVWYGMVWYGTGEYWGANAATWTVLFTDENNMQLDTTTDSGI